MSNSALPLILLAALAAGVGGGMLSHALDAPPPARATPAPAVTPEVADLLRRVSALETRLADRARDTDAPAPGINASGKGAVPARREHEGAPEGPDAAPGAPTDPAQESKDPLEGILGRAYGYEESRSLFRRLSRDHSAIGDVITRLEAETRKRPSADLYAALATAYAAKTAYDTPPGPEQGTVWAKAEQAYDEAIRLDPEHWEARYGKAFGDSMAPEFVGLRPKAIREFEELMEIQERKPPAPEHAEVYVRLGTLYKDAGNTKKAQEVWRRGLDRFPDSKRLTESLALVEEK